MKSLKRHITGSHSLLSHPSKAIPAISSLAHQCSQSSSLSPSCETPKPTFLTQQEITKINLLIPRLCLTDHLTTAIHLTTTALLTDPPPPPNSISLSVLAHSLASLPDMSKPMSLLTVLRHNPQAHPHLTSLASLLINSYIKTKRPKEALKMYHWMLRPDSPCGVGKTVYGVLVSEFCGFGLVLEALRVLRHMVGAGLVPVGKLRETVYRSLLREARVKEAVELHKALSGCVGDANGNFVNNVILLLDSMIGNWSE